MKINKVLDKIKANRRNWIQYLITITKDNKRKLNTKGQKKPEKAIEDTSGCVRHGNGSTSGPTPRLWSIILLGRQQRICFTNYQQ
jgi:hypothetical protein